MSYQEALQGLQEELVDLKKKHGKHVALRKSKSQAKTPFPVTINATVVAPESASSFDIGSIELCIVLEESILRLKGVGVGDGRMDIADKKLWMGNGKAMNEGGAWPLHVRVMSEDVPEQLRCRIGDDLEVYWSKRVLEVRQGYYLDGLLMRLQAGFVEFLLSLPRCVEAYEATDGSGATVRRFTLVAPEPLGTEEDGNHLDSGRDTEERDAVVVGDKENIDEETDGPEFVFDDPLAKEVSMLKIRFGESNFKICVEDGCVDSSNAKFFASILPSDPDWEEGPLDFMGNLAVLPDGGLSVSLRLAPMAPILWNIKLHIEGALREEAARVSGQLNAGRALLKFVEGHIAEVVHEGEALLEGKDDHHFLSEKVQTGVDAICDPQVDPMPHEFEEGLQDGISIPEEVRCRVQL